MFLYSATVHMLRGQIFHHNLKLSFEFMHPLDLSWVFPFHSECSCRNQAGITSISIAQQRRCQAINSRACVRCDSLDSFARLLTIRTLYALILEARPSTDYGLCGESVPSIFYISIHKQLTELRQTPTCIDLQAWGAKHCCRFFCSNIDVLPLQSLCEIL